MRILVACDKFKGTLTAEQANAAIAEALPGQQLHCQAIADGGEGTAQVLAQALGGSAQQVVVQGPLHATLKANFWLASANSALAKSLSVQPGESVAFLDMSAASGLQLMDNAALDPWHASTFGTGQLLLAATTAAASHIVLGLGGSATNDGGAGMAQALGYQFLDANGRRLDQLPADLNKAATITTPTLSLPTISVACDVDNPLLGANGAIAVYGSQKGVPPAEQARYESRLQHLDRLCSTTFGHSQAKTPGAGAAGGLGFGLLSFTKAKLKPGFALLAELLDLNTAIASADLIITGEGSLDAQSLQGKGPAALATLARANGVPCVALCGQWDETRALSDHFAAVFALVAAGRPPPQDSAAALQSLVAANKDALLAFAASG